VRLLVLSIEFLTRLRIRALAPSTPEELARATVLFPLVGALIGALSWAILALGSLVARSPGVAAWLALGVTTFLTAGLHLDGLMDLADGLSFRRAPEEILRIMRDSRVGAFGVLAAVLVLLGKFVCLRDLASDPRVMSLALMPPMVGRWSVTAVGLWGRRYAAEGFGVGRAFVDGARPRYVLGATGLTLIVAVGLFGVGGAVLVGVGALASWCLAATCRRALGGITGDVLGAGVEITEVTVFLATMVLLGANPDLFFPSWSPVL
jgi:adenosylcobinamide-GDP ribazoletransferase